MDPARFNVPEGDEDAGAPPHQVMEEVEGEELSVLEPVNGIVQPPFIPTPDRPGRKTNKLKYLQNVVVSALWKHHWAWPFEEPVNTVKLNIPDYYQIIKRPMDLGTIKKRLEHGYYYSASECIDDLETMFWNCFLYNKADSEVVHLGKSLERLYRSKLARLPEVEVDEPVRRVGGGAGRKKKIAHHGHYRTGPYPSATTTRPMPALIPAPEYSMALGMAQMAAMYPEGFPAQFPASSATSGEEDNSTYVQIPWAPPAKHAKAKKKGVKRKADSTTTTPWAETSYMDSESEPTSSFEAGPGKIAVRRGSRSGREIKTPKKHLDLSPRYLTPKPKGKLSPSLKACEAILKELFSKKLEAVAYPFYAPVDVRNCPDYYDIIKKPMDLGTIKQKLNDRKYRNAAELATDMRQMISNCYKYNNECDLVVDMVKKVSHFFEESFARIPEEPPAPESEAESDSDEEADEAVGPKPFSALQQKVKLIQNQLRDMVAQEKRQIVNAKKKGSKKAKEQKRYKPVSKAKAKRVPSATTLRPTGTILGRKPSSSAAVGPFQKVYATHISNAVGGSGLPPPAKKQKSETRVMYEKQRSKVVGGVKSGGGARSLEFLAEPKSYDRDDRRELSMAVNKLPGEKLRGFVDIIRAGEPSLRDMDLDKFQIDFETMQPSTLRSVELYIASCKREQTRKPYVRKTAAQRRAELEKLQPGKGPQDGTETIEQATKRKREGEAELKPDVDVERLSDSSSSDSDSDSGSGSSSSSSSSSSGSSSSSSGSSSDSSDSEDESSAKKVKGDACNLAVSSSVAQARNKNIAPSATPATVNAATTLNKAPPTGGPWQSSVVRHAHAPGVNRNPAPRPRQGLKVVPSSTPRPEAVDKPKPIVDQNGNSLIISVRPEDQGQVSDGEAKPSWSSLAQQQRSTAPAVPGKVVTIVGGGDGGGSSSAEAMPTLNVNQNAATHSFLKFQQLAKAKLAQGKQQAKVEKVLGLSGPDKPKPGAPVVPVSALLQQIESQKLNPTPATPPRSPELPRVVLSPARERMRRMAQEKRRRDAMVVGVGCIDMNLHSELLASFALCNNLM